MSPTIMRPDSLFPAPFCWISNMQYNRTLTNNKTYF